MISFNISWVIWIANFAVLIILHKFVRWLTFFQFRNNYLRIWLAFFNFFNCIVKQALTFFEWLTFLYHILLFYCTYVCLIRIFVHFCLHCSFWAFCHTVAPLQSMFPLLNRCVYSKWCHLVYALIKSQRLSSRSIVL